MIWGLVFGYIFFYAIFKLGKIVAKIEIRKDLMEQDTHFLNSFDQIFKSTYGSNNISCLIEKFIEETRGGSPTSPYSSQLKKYIKLKIKRSEGGFTSTN